MDLKQELQQRGGGGSANTKFSGISSSSRSSATSAQSDGGNNSSCSNNNHSASTNTGESFRGSSPLAASLVGGANAILFNSNGSSHNVSSNPSSASHLAGRPRPLGELDGPPGELDRHDSLLLKFPRLRDPASPHSPALERQVLYHVDGASRSSVSHHSYLSSSNHSSNHGSPTSTYAGTSNTYSLFDGVSSHSRVYPYGILQEEPIRHHSSSTLSVVPAPQASGSRAQHPNLPFLNPEPSASFFTQEQLLDFTRQTFVFKHFVAGVAPPPSLLLPIISSVVNMTRIGAGHVLFGGNAGLLGVGGLRGNIDPEPGRCRRTDGKKWRCAREAVHDQKYCEKHMHRGRHRARAGSKPVIVGSSDTLKSLPPNCSANAADSIATALTVPFVSSAPKEPQLLFSLQPASMASVQINRSSSSSGNCSNPLHADGPSSKLAAQPDHPPNLAELLKANASDKATGLPARARDDTDSPPFSFACQPTNRDTVNSSLSQIVETDPWTRCNRAADNASSGLSWFEQLSEEHNKRSSFSTELSIATLKSPLANLSAKFVGNQPDDLVSSVEASDFMGLGIGKAEEDRYSVRSTWLPTAWDGPSIGGPLGEALQPSATVSSGGRYGGSFANNGGGRCLNLIENESWVHQESVRVGSPAKDGHSPNVASPTGILQMKASFLSYSDSSSGASSPRSALKLESSGNLGFL